MNPRYWDGLEWAMAAMVAAYVAVVVAAATISIRAELRFCERYFPGEVHECFWAGNYEVRVIENAPPEGT